MYSISEMSRSMFWMCLTLIFVYLTSRKCNEYNFAVLSFMAIAAIVFLRRKMRFEGYRVDIMMRNYHIYDNKKIKFISLGYLHDIFIVNTDSRHIGKTLTKEDLKNEIIYTPKKTSITTIKLMETLGLDKERENIRNITYTTMLGILKNEDSIGIITKEYIKDELEEGKLSILKTDFELEPLEYGIYININNRFKELNDLIRIMKDEFIKK